MKASRQTSAGPRRAGGFTIIEVLAALMLIAIVLPTVVHGTLLCLDTAAHAGMQARAASLAQAKLSELAATGQFDQAMLSGNFGEQWPQFAWMAIAEPWEDERLVQLDVAVVWTRRGREYDVTMSTLIYDDIADE